MLVVLKGLFCTYCVHVLFISLKIITVKVGNSFYSSFFSGGKVYSLNKGCHTCMIKHTMHVQSLHCSVYLTWGQFHKEGSYD